MSRASFIPALEENGLIVRVGSWVIAALCEQIALWMRSSIGAMQVSVNVSSPHAMRIVLTGHISYGAILEPTYETRPAIMCSRHIDGEPLVSLPADLAPTTLKVGESKRAE